jgi:hypothetical protein
VSAAVTVPNNADLGWRMPCVEVRAAQTVLMLQPQKHATPKTAVLLPISISRAESCLQCQRNAGYCHTPDHQ